MLVTARAVVDGVVVAAAVPAACIVDVAIVIVVALIARYFVRVRPNIVPEVKVVDVYPSVYNPYDRLVATSSAPQASSASMSASLVPLLWPVLLRSHMLPSE